MPTATLKIFLAFGDPKRLRTAELSNWTGKAVAGPRSEFDKVLERMREDPNKLGGNMSGNFHGQKSVRLLGKYRLMYRVNDQEKAVYLIGFGHRKSVYG